MIYDFHTHTFLSDGALSTIELIRRALVKGYAAIGLTDHVGVGSLGRAITEVEEDCALAKLHWPILALAGVELTHLPAQAIAAAAHHARERGAKLVIVHGETTSEPVEKGTNLAAVQSPHVDILAHPGLITVEEASLAAQSNVFLEISGRQSHSLTNAHVVSVAQKTGAKLLINSDAHNEDDLLTSERINAIAAAAGLNEQQIYEIAIHNPLSLIQKINSR